MDRGRIKTLAFPWGKAKVKRLLQIKTSLHDSVAHWAARPCTPGKVPRQKHSGPGVDSLEQCLAQVSGADQLLVDEGVDLDAVPEDALQQEAPAAGLQDRGSHGGSWG